MLYSVCGLVEKSAYTTRYGRGEGFDYRRRMILLERYEEIVRSEGFLPRSGLLEPAVAADWAAELYVIWIFITNKWRNIMSSVKSVNFILLIIFIYFLFGCSSGPESNPKGVISIYIDGYLTNDYEKIVISDYNSLQSISYALRDAPESMKEEAFNKKMSEHVKKFQGMEKSKQEWLKMRRFASHDLMGDISLFSALYPGVKYSVLETKDTTQNEQMINGCEKYTLVKLMYSSSDQAPLSGKGRVKEGVFKVYLQKIKTVKGKIMFKVYNCELTEFGEVSFSERE